MQSSSASSASSSAYSSASSSAYSSASSSASSSSTLNPLAKPFVPSKFSLSHYPLPADYENSPHYFAPVGERSPFTTYPSEIFPPFWVPTPLPSFIPSSIPSSAPSSVPSFVPSFVPSSAPSFVPSYVSSFAPSSVSSFAPSSVSSFSPSPFSSRNITTTCPRPSSLERRLFLVSAPSSAVFPTKPSFTSLSRFPVRPSRPFPFASPTQFGKFKPSSEAKSKLVSCGKKRGREEMENDDERLPARNVKAKVVEVVKAIGFAIVSFLGSKRAYDDDEEDEGDKKPQEREIARRVRRKF